ncbi:MAG: DUF4375 domain-containing protein [Nitrospira sp.]|nr:DUF4375 domain-containing protein [Nitrospira sp.]MCB1053067.1 DUF4375 domain-containing protein [Acidobacteriota bacterium]MCB9399051.1 DUF4375 domain-containing protein [Acidobacteriota bacterium]
MSEPGLVYWRVLEPIWDQVSIYNGADTFLTGFTQLSEIQQHLFAAHWCQSEVRNGGFHQFFSNPTGVLAPEAVRAFAVIGLVEAAEVLTRALRFFGAHYPRDQSVRLLMLRSLVGQQRSEWDPFYALDPEFYRVIDSSSGRFARLADVYAESTH